MRTGSIYLIKNKINGKCYVGQSVNVEKRWGEHINNDKSLIGKALSKYGENNFIFSVLEKGIPIDQIYEKESQYIAKYNGFQEGYNQVPIGGGLPTGKEHPNFGKSMSEEQKRKISDSLKGNKNPNYGVNFSKEHKRQISDNHANVEGNDNPNSKISKEVGIQILKEYNTTSKTYQDLADDYPISKSTVGKICRYEHWTTEEYQDDYSSNIRSGEDHPMHNCGCAISEPYKINKEDGYKIYEKYKKGIDVKTLSDEFNLSNSIIYKIVKGQHWTTEDLESIYVEEGYKKVTKELGIEIFEKYHSSSNNYSHEDLADEYNIGVSTIDLIVSGNHKTTKKKLG